MASAYSKPIPKEAWRAPVVRKLDHAEAERARQLLIERGLIPSLKSEK